MVISLNLIFHLKDWNKFIEKQSICCHHLLIMIIFKISINLKRIEKWSQPTFEGVHDSEVSVIKQPMMWVYEYPTIKIWIFVCKKEIFYIFKTKGAIWPSQNIPSSVWLFSIFFLFWERLLLLSMSFITLLINLPVTFNDKSLIYECSWDISATV